VRWIAVATAVGHAGHTVGFVAAHEGVDQIDLEPPGDESTDRSAPKEETGDPDGPRALGADAIVVAMFGRHGAV